MIPQFKKKKDRINILVKFFVQKLMARHILTPGGNTCCSIEK